MLSGQRPATWTSVHADTQIVNDQQVNQTHQVLQPGCCSPVTWNSAETNIKAVTDPGSERLVLILLFWPAKSKVELFRIVLAR